MSAGYSDSSAWPAAESRTAALVRRWWPFALGALVATAALPLATLDRAWIGFIIAALAGLATWIAVVDRTRLLSAVFVLSLQAGAAYRIFYERAGSDGLAMQLSVMVGLVLVASWWSSGALPAVPRTRLGRVALVILACSALSLLTTSERFVGLAHFLFEIQLFFIYWVALRLVRSHDDVERVVGLLLVTLAIQSVIYAVQSALGLTFTLEGDVIEQDVIPRPGGTVSTNPAGFASFIIPLLLIAVARMVDRERRGGGLWLAAVIVLGMAAIGLTYTRVAWAGLAGALVFLFASAWAAGSLRGRHARWIAVAAVLAGLAFWPLMAARLTESPVSSAYDERAGLNRIAWSVIAAHPITGIGTGAYSQRFKDYLPSDLADQWLYTVHNEFLLRTAETGIAGGIAFIVFLVVGFRIARRLSRDPTFSLRTLGLGCSAGILALAWQMYWVPWRGFEYNAILWFLLGVCDAAAGFSAGDGQGSASTDNSRGAGGRTADEAASRAPMSGPAPVQGT
jgi:O-antigen ligase